MMHERYKSQCIYLAETDVHFPELTVGETIQFAAEACSKRVVVPNGSETSRSGLRAHWQSIQTTLQLDSVSQTIIGSAVHRGVSGGEKRRVTLGETLLSNASLQCWDNSTRGMDSATALTIIQAFQTSAKSHGSIAVASLYQASQAVVDLFDCILLLYDGSQIFFGTTSEAIDYFTGLGFEMHQRTSAADYLTAITNPAEARQLVREGIEHFPRTKEDFVRTWKESHLYHDLIQRIEKQRSEGTSSARFDNHITRSTHNISISKEIEICMGRCYRRIINSISIPVSAVVGNAVLAAIIGGLFLNLDETAASVTIRSNLLFLSVLLNGFMSGSEVNG
jgi:ATP-binding cassette subfamily G (WHITE) protein 2 (PDR)